MINIDLQRIYLNDIKEGDLYCLTYLNKNILGCPVEIYKIFKTFQSLKMFCEDNTSDLQLSVCNMTPDEVKKIQNNDYDVSYSNID